MADLVSIRTVAAILDADDFKKFWDRDAQTLAVVIERIGRVDTKS